MSLLNKLKMLKPKKSDVLWLLLLIAGCRVKYAPPSVETCIHNEDMSAECNDMRLPEGEQSYTKYDLTNYMCTNTNDYGKLYAYASDLREKLIKCENSPRN